MVNTEQRVQEEDLTGLDTVADEVIITSLQSDIDEREAVSNFVRLGCGCSKVNKQPCSYQFSPEYVASMRESCAELSHSELDMAVMGHLLAGMNTSSSVSIAARHKESDREKVYTTFYHQGKPVCQNHFSMVLGRSG